MHSNLYRHLQAVWCDRVIVCFACKDHRLDDADWALILLNLLMPCAKVCLIYSSALEGSHLCLAALTLLQHCGVAFHPAEEPPTYIAWWLNYQDVALRSYADCACAGSEGGDAICGAAAVLWCRLHAS